MPRYDLFGDTVCFASRMESTSKAMRIQVAELTYFLLRNAQKSTFNMTLRLGPDGLPGIQVKGKGRVTTYWIDGVQGEADCVSPDTSAHASIAADLPPVTDTTASTLRQAAAALVLDGPASDFLLTRPSSVLTAGAGRATSANSGGVDEIQDVVDGPAYGALNRSSSAASQGLRLSSRERDHKVAEVNGPASGPVEVPAAPFS
ncbi:hypothetical protein T484DRAFT_3101519 [Baffinella frigidus]|nr:hypothetical protein T484DRAFT_3101519 [Cryptophyta sp. CCMP2293]